MNIILWFFLIVAMTGLVFSDSNDDNHRKGD